MLDKALVGPDAAMLMPDAVAHKGYDQLRRHRRHIAPVLKRAKQSIETGAGQPLASLPAALPDLSALTALSARTNAVARAVPRLIDVQTNLEKQLPNLETWFESVGPYPIVDYHRRFLAIGIRELQRTIQSLTLTVESARGAIAVALLAVDREATLARENAEKQTERRHCQVEARLATASIALAVTQLIDDRATAKILALPHRLPRLGRLLAPSPASQNLESANSAWLLFLVHLVLTALVACLVWWLTPRLIARFSPRTAPSTTLPATAASEPTPHDP